MRQPLILFSLTLIACQQEDTTDPNTTNPLQDYVMERVDEESLTADPEVCFYGGAVDAMQDTLDESIVVLDLLDNNDEHILDMVAKFIENPELNNVELNPQNQQVQISVNNELASSNLMNIIKNIEYIEIDIELHRDPIESDILTGDWVFCIIE